MENCLPLRLISNNLSRQVRSKTTKHHFGVVIELGSAHACDSRIFVAEAEACIDVSSLPVVGTMTISSNLDLESEPQIFDVSGSFRCLWERHWTMLIFGSEVMKSKPVGEHGLIVMGH